MFWFHEYSFFKEDEFSEADDDAYYRDDDLDLDFERFHIRHGNREIGSSASEESDDDDEFGDEDGPALVSIALIRRIFEHKKWQLCSAEAFPNLNLLR